MGADLLPRPRFAGSQFDVAGYQFVASCKVKRNKASVIFHGMLFIKSKTTGDFAEDVKMRL